MNTQRPPRIPALVAAVAVASILMFTSTAFGARIDSMPDSDLSELGTGIDPGVADLLGAPDSLGIDWGALFTVHGKLKDQIGKADAVGNGIPDYLDLYGGIEAVLLEDNFSAGVAIDMSALVGAETLADSVVYNGTVSAAHDLGNAWVYTAFDSRGDQVVYAAVERLETGADTWVEFELNQDRVAVTGGIPWSIGGERLAGDLLVRVDVAQGVVDSVTVGRWAALGEDGGFETVAAYGGLASVSCNGEPALVLFCSSEPRASIVQDLWDTHGAAVEPIPPDSVLEVGVNVGRVLGDFVDFTAIQIRTPEDIVPGGFRETGYYGREAGNVR